MIIEQTMKIPADRRLTIDVPREIPTGEVRVAIRFSVPVASAGGSAADSDFLPSYPPDEAIKIAAQRLADPNRKPPSSFRGILSPGVYGDGVAYQRKLRDEWDN
jgi:hypothetical protein